MGGGGGGGGGKYVLVYNSITVVEVFNDLYDISSHPSHWQDRLDGAINQYPQWPCRGREYGRVIGTVTC